VTLYYRQPYTYEPIRFRVPELHAEWADGMHHIESSDGIEVVRACDYDELRRVYEETRESLIRNMQK
jgi:hypothetical protein